MAKTLSAEAGRRGHATLQSSGFRRIDPMDTAGRNE